MIKKLLFSATIFLCSAAMADPWIQSFTGSKDSLGIVRDGTEIDVTVFVSLTAGDVINVSGSENSITLVYSNGSSRRITNRESPFNVKSPETGSRQLERLLAQASADLAELKSDPETIVKRTTRGISGAEDFQRIIPPKALIYLTEGDRRLYFKWRGKPNPESAILMQDKETILHFFVSGDDVLEASTPGKLLLLPGRYEFVVRYADSVHRTRLIVIPENELPSMPTDVLVAGLSHELASVTFATWLAVQKNGKWITEAYQLMRNLDSPSARQIANVIENSRS